MRHTTDNADRSSVFFARHPVFTTGDYLSARGGERRTADNLLGRYVASGRLLRVRRGLYASVPLGQEPDPVAVDPYLVATQLADDATVAYHAALQWHGRVYSVSHRLEVVSGQQLGPFRFGGHDFLPVRLPMVLASSPPAGVIAAPHAGRTVRVTTLERTLVDVLDAPELGGGWEEVWRSLEMVDYFDLDTVVAYATMLGSALTAARVGYFLEQHREQFFVTDDHLEQLARLAPRQPRYFDRERAAGSLVKRWNLIVPPRVMLRSWAEVT